MKLSRSLLIYTLSSVLASAVPLALLPFLTRHLSEAEYGTMATLTTLIAFFTPPLMWGITAMISVEYLRLPAADVPTFLSSLLRLPMAGFVLLSLVSALTAELAATLLDVPAAWFAALPLFAMLAALPAILSAVLRMRNQAIAFGVYQIFCGQQRRFAVAALRHRP
jgi:O-antigen/teichoic acid export membrane protein